MQRPAPPPTSLESPRLVVSGLSKDFGDLEALSDLSFSIGAGEVLGLVGPNGAGKTTAMRCITGILRATRGQIAIDGFDLHHHPAEAKRRLALIPDTPHPFEMLTVTEHLRFVGMAYGVADVEAQIPGLLDELVLTEKRDALASGLSRGMRQKLAIACAFLREPAVMLFDEPLTGLDPLAIRGMRGAIQARAARGTAVIISSHLLDLVERLCDRVLILHKGVALADGSLEDIRRAATASGNASLEDAFFAITQPEDGPPDVDGAQDPA